MDSAVTSDEEEVKGQVYGFNSHFNPLSDSSESSEDCNADDTLAIADAPVLRCGCVGVPMTEVVVQVGGLARWTQVSCD